MEKLTLRQPIEADEAQIWAYRQAFVDHGDTAHGTGSLEECACFADWLSGCRDNLRPETVRPGLMCATTLMAVRETDGALVGFANIRHALNDYLLNFGGHIGYSVHPAERRKGYAGEILRQALELCRSELGLDRVLLTCDADNEPSRRTILAGGGVFEDERDQDGVAVQQYWIAL